MFASNTSQVSSDATYIEDVFSTYLYTGNGSSQTITNGIDLAGKGGLFWVKARAVAGSHGLMHGSGTELCSHSTNGLPASQPYTFGSSGITFTGGSWTGFSSPNESGRIYTSWTFRKQPKFFDVVTYTGDGTNPRSIAHNLGSTPGCIIIKRTDTTADWVVRHRSMNPSSPWSYLALLNTTDARFSSNDQTPTSTTFVVGDNGSRPNTNVNGATYVAYLFAHNAGGFGAAGTDNVISCGSYTTGGSGYTSTVNLGYEPQWILYKQVNDSGSGWTIIDNMRGWLGSSGSSAYLLADSSAAESSQSSPYITPTGFVDPGVVALNATIIYIAIRRGPMKTPTSGTQVYKPLAYTGTGNSSGIQDFGFPVDMWLHIGRTGAARNNLAGYEWPVFTRLLSVNNALNTTLNNAWGGGWGSSYLSIDNNFGVRLVDSYYLNVSGGSYSSHGFRRAPGFMDIVAYNGHPSGSTLTVNHSLGVVPELIIFKRRDSVSNWPVWRTGTGTGTTFTYLNSSGAEADQGVQILKATPTSTTLSLEGWGPINAAGGTHIAYLFATCPGVSKVGTYTGTGTTLQINCGFTSGARFVMIRRLSGTGDWYVWDTARGIVSGNDPFSRLNLTSVEDATTDYIDPYSAGFEISSTAPADINGSGGTFLYLAIA